MPAFNESVGMIKLKMCAEVPASTLLFAGIETSVTPSPLRSNSSIGVPPVGERVKLPFDAVPIGTFVKLVV